MEIRRPDALRILFGLDANAIGLIGIHLLKDRSLVEGSDALWFLVSLTALTMIVLSMSMLAIILLRMRMTLNRFGYVFLTISISAAISLNLATYLDAQH